MISLVNLETIISALTVDEIVPLKHEVPGGSDKNNNSKDNITIRIIERNDVIEKHLIIHANEFRIEKINQKINCTARNITIHIASTTLLMLVFLNLVVLRSDPEKKISFMSTPVKLAPLSFAPLNLAPLEIEVP